MSTGIGSERGSQAAQPDGASHRQADRSPDGTGLMATLYSFRRCPYAIRARLALAAAGWQPGRDLELREVALRARPPELLEASAPGTVPVLVTAAGTVLPESLEIMHWALDQRDPEGWQSGWSRTEAGTIAALIETNDGRFKHHLDRCKYASRYGAEGLAQQQEHRRAALAMLRDWERRLQQGGWLLGARPSLADMALLPFVRQLRLADPAGFDREPDLMAVQQWLQRFLDSAELKAVLEPPWAFRSPWHSPRWLYHLALAEDWRAARSEGEYRISTRGLTLEQVGFIHASHRHQLEATWQRFYADAESVVLLCIDPERLIAAGVEVRLEAAEAGGELFPHLYGPLPVAAVLHSGTWKRSGQ